MRRMTVVLVAALLLATTLAGCVDQGAQGPDDTSTVEGSEWQLNPSNLTVPAGENVTIAFDNVGDAAHNWVLDLDGDGEPERKTETIQPGSTATVTISVEAPGEYAYFCDDSGHRDAGMEGTLTVTA